MRVAFLILSFSLLISSAFGVVIDNPIDLSSTDDSVIVGKVFTVTVRAATEDTVTFTVNADKPRKVSMLTKTNAWGIGRATGVYTTKLDVDANRVEIKKITGKANSGTTGNQTVQYFIQAKSVDDTIIIEVLE